MPAARSASRSHPVPQCASRSAAVRPGWGAHCRPAESCRACSRTAAAGAWSSQTPAHAACGLSHAALARALTGASRVWRAPVLCRPPRRSECGCLHAGRTCQQAAGGSRTANACPGAAPRAARGRTEVDVAEAAAAYLAPQAVPASDADVQSARGHRLLTLRARRALASNAGRALQPSTYGILLARCAQARAPRDHACYCYSFAAHALQAQMELGLR